MITIKVITGFAFADQGIHVTSYAPGVHKVSKRCAEIALAEGWAKKVAGKTKPKKKKVHKK